MGNNARKKKLIEMTENMLRSTSPTKIKQYHLQFLTETQKLAWEAFQQNDILFLTGAAGSGKSFLAVAFAIHEILEGNKEKIVLTRPLVEAGENLGFLPGDISEKVFPYMLPLYDCLEKMCGRKGEDRRDYVDRRIELAPIAYLRGRSFENSICVLDEAQNCTLPQFKLFLSRLGCNSKMIITGDPSQSDLGKNPDLLEVIHRVSGIEGIGTVTFNEQSIVRHPLVAKILRNL